MANPWDSILSQSRSKKAAAPDFVETLFGFRIKAHLMHLGTDSFAEHKALGELYEAIDGFIDDFTETYIGALGGKQECCQVESVSLPSNSSPNELVDALEAYLKGPLDKACQGETALLNMRDELLGTTQKVRYLLTLS